MGARGVELSDRRQFRRDRTFSSGGCSVRCLSGQTGTRLFTKCSATFGNGRAAPTRPTPAIALRPARLANTTANSCATNTSCAAVPARHRALISAAPIAISFNRKNAGSSPGSDSHAIQHESVGRDRWARRSFNPTMTGDSITAPPQVSAPESRIFWRMLLLVCRRIRARSRANISMMSAARRCFRRSASCRNITSPAPRSIFWIEVAPKSRRSLDRSIELIGLGTGAGTKTRILIEALENPAVYIPVDISEKQLRQSTALFRKIFPDLEILPVCADYLQPVVLPSPRHKPARNVVYFPGIDHRQFRAG